MVAPNMFLAIPYVCYVKTYDIYEFRPIYFDMHELRCLKKRNFNCHYHQQHHGLGLSVR